MNVPLQTRAELEVYLASLPPVKDGFVRVFRGQTTRYEKLLASGNRGTPDQRAEAWRLFTHLMASRIANKIVTAPEDGYASLDDVLYWFEAIKQHYGPGSPFIDVTHSLDAALWFASHKAQWKRVVDFMGPGEVPYLNQFPVVRKWLQYGRAEENGVLYVLDVHRTPNGRTYNHGAFVDLRKEAPPVFGTSARIQVQQACLVFSDRYCNDGDLSEFLACEPIEIAPSVSNGAMSDGTVFEVFPPAIADPWFARFLDAPLGWDLDGDEEAPNFLTTPLNTTLYAPAPNATDAEKARSGVPFRLIFPALMLNHLAQEDDSPTGLRDAIGILLEGPITVVTQPVATGDWNEQALWQGIATEAPVYNAKSGEQIGLVPLNNVFFEFSHLEHAHWDVYTNDGSFAMVRAVWLTRNDQSFDVAIVVQNAGQAPEIIGGQTLTFSAAEGRIVMRATNDEDSAAVPLGNIAKYGKHILHALFALHHLGTDYKVAPLPTTSTHNGYLASLQMAIARLEQVRMPCNGAFYARMRNTENGALYLGGGQNKSDLLVDIKSDNPFGSVPYIELLLAFKPVLLKAEAGARK